MSVRKIKNCFGKTFIGLNMKYEFTYLNPIKLKFLVKHLTWVLIESRAEKFRFNLIRYPSGCPGRGVEREPPVCVSGVLSVLEQSAWRRVRGTRAMLWAGRWAGRCGGSPCPPSLSHHFWVTPYIATEMLIQLSKESWGCERLAGWLDFNTCILVILIQPFNLSLS